MSDDGASDWDDELERLEDLVNEGQHVFDGNVKDAKEKNIDGYEFEDVLNGNSRNPQDEDIIVLDDADEELPCSTGTRRNPTATERTTAVHIHRCTLLALLCRAIVRNTWCDSKNLQAMAASVMRSDLKLPHDSEDFRKEDITDIIHWFRRKFAPISPAGQDRLGPEGLENALGSRSASDTDCTLLLLCMLRGLGLAARLVQAITPVHWRLREVVETSSGVYFVRALPRKNSNKSLDKVSAQIKGSSLKSLSVSSGHDTQMPAVGRKRRSVLHPQPASCTDSPAHDPRSKSCRTAGEQAAPEEGTMGMAEEGTDLFLAQQLVLEAACQAQISHGGAQAAGVAPLQPVAAGLRQPKVPASRDAGPASSRADGSAAPARR